MQDTDRAGTFSGQVLVLFASHVLAAGAGIVNGILLARLLGPEAKGEYTFLVLLPASAVVLSQLGLPAAFMYFAARGQTLGAVGKSILLTAALGGVALGGVLVMVLVVQDALPETIHLTQVLVVLVALPLALYSTLSTGIVMGRKGVRWYAGINTAYPFITTLLLVIILGGFGPSVNGALAVYLATTSIQAIAFAIAARRVTAAVHPAEPVSYGSLFRYGLTYYPASLASFFSYRLDIYLIAFLATDALAAIGYYSLAVGLAEMIFFFPTAVSTMFFPHVAGAPREESDRQVALVSRVTLLVTTTFAVLLIPAAAVMIWVLLPAFTPSFPALVVLLPGVVALSAANVVGGFITGIGRPGVNSSINVASLTVNVVANVLLIPRLGIIGAAAASLVSYSFSALLLTTAAAHFAGTSVLDFWLVRMSDIRYTVATSASLVRRLRASAARVGAGSRS